MSEQLKESLSAAMDDEADAFELRRFIDEAAGDDELREQWHRYHVVRDVLRGSSAATANATVGAHAPGLRESMWAELNAEVGEEPQAAADVTALPSQQKRPDRSPWLGRVAGLAVATVVAGLVAFNGGVFDSQEATIADTGQFGTDEQFPTGEPQFAQPVLYSHFTDADRARQNGRILRHIQARAMNQNSVASFVKLATFANQGPRVSAPPVTAPDATDAPGRETAPR